MCSPVLVCTERKLGPAPGVSVRGDNWTLVSFEGVPVRARWRRATVFVMSDPTALPNFDVNTNDTQLRDRVFETLKAMGANPEFDDDGDVRITVDGQLLFIRTMDAGLPFMRVFGQWQINESVTADEDQQLRLANDLTTRLNFIKVCMHDQTGEGAQRLLISASDIVVSDDMPLDRVLGNSIIGILNAVHTWHLAASGMSLDEALSNQQARIEEQSRRASEEAANAASADS